METEIALLKQRMEDSDRFIKQQFEDIKAVIRSGLDGVTRAQTEQMERIGEMKKVVDRTELQAIKTNGRVTALENTEKKNSPEIDVLMKFRWMILGGVALIGIVGTAFIFMASKWVTSEIHSVIIQFETQMKESELRQRQYIDDRLNSL